MGYSTVLFDLDGTLTDSQQGIVASFRHALAAFDIDVDEAAVRTWIGPPLGDGLAALGVPAAQVPAAMDRYRAHFADIGIRQNRLYDGVPEMLAGLDGAGVTLGLTTSKLVDFAEEIVARLGIAGHFQLVAGAARDGSRITKADIVAFALETLGRPKSAAGALVGDRGDDMLAAVRHGLLPVGVSWGYGDHEELRAAGSRVIVDDPADLVALLAA